MHRNICSLLIPGLILLASQSLYHATATNSEFSNSFAKQSRLFNKLGNNWAMEGSDDTSLDDITEARANPGLRLLEQLLRARQRAPVPYSEYDQSPEGYDFDSERDVESNIPYGVHNVYDTATGRIVRSKSRHKSTFQPLCPSKRETVFLNLDPDYEYRPDYYDEVRCASAPHHSSTPHHNGNKITGTAVCTEVGFTCIQLNGTLFLTKRTRGDDGCWESETRTISAGCECMWPKHTLGDIMAHH